MEELFRCLPRLDEEGARRLVSSIPLELNLIDLGGGLSPEAADLVKVRPEHLTSRPMLAYWRGVSAVGWQGPKPVDLAGFMSVVMSTATDTNIAERLHEKNFAIITHDYMNLSNRLGFHFATIEAFLGAPGESYVSFTFYGGGAELPRRMRRVRFLTRILEGLDFGEAERTPSRRIDGYDCPTFWASWDPGPPDDGFKQLNVIDALRDAVEQHYREVFSKPRPGSLRNGRLTMGKRISVGTERAPRLVGEVKMGRILAVDDELDMLALLKMIIEGYSDHQVMVTNNPLEASELLEKETFDLILTDLKMPGMDGLEVLAKAKQQDAEALVMVITAYGSLESAEEAMAKGAFDYITKPFRKEQILLAIDKAMRWRDMVRQNKALKQRLDGN
jgi:CheY-like chemotaxis protein